MKKINDGLDFLIYSNKNIKEQFNTNSTNLKQEFESYLNDIDEFLKSIDKNEDNLKKIIIFLQKKYIIQEIPDSYMRFSKGYIKKLGYYNENGNSYRTNLNNEQYETVLKLLQDDQMNSLIPWIEFLCNKKKQYPIWFRYYIFNKIMKIGSVYVNINEMSKRSKSTTQPYILCNYDIIDNIYNLLNKYIFDIEMTEEELLIIGDGINFKDIYLSFARKSFRPNNYSDCCEQCDIKKR